MAGFVVVGNFLCWSYPEEKIVHILDMSNMNKINTKRLTSADLVNKTLKGFANLSKLPGGLFNARNDDGFERVGHDGTTSQAN
jgi:hypothetical protein